MDAMHIARFRFNGMFPDRHIFLAVPRLEKISQKQSVDEFSGDDGHLFVSVCSEYIWLRVGCASKTKKFCILIQYESIIYCAR